MRWLILGALLGLLVVFPHLLPVVLGAAAPVVSKPLVVAFALGLAAGVRLHRARRWAA